MVENVQQIEAMLAAYIDEELTTDERAELERHLEANPSHRALILELTGHRDLLRSLPREAAPEDLSEPLEGAIEREALLGGGDPLTEFKSARTRRWWPQLLAAAAIFILRRHLHPRLRPRGDRVLRAAAEAPDGCDRAAAGV
jgi:anti-sigma factor RsiW